MALYGRILTVRVAGLLFAGVRVTVDISQDSGSSQDSGHVDLWNLSRANEEHVKDRATEVVVEGGHEGRVGLLFRGPVQQALSRRIIGQGVARVTRLELGDFAHAPAGSTRPMTEGLGGVSARSYAGPVLVRQVVADLAGDMGLDTDSLEAIPADATVSNFAWTGRSVDGLNVLLRGIDRGWYADDRTVRVRRQGRREPSGRTRLLLTPQAGLIGAPVPTEEGARVEMLLNPDIHRGARLRVESDLEHGDFDVVAYRHQGDNWEGRFVTICECREAA